MISTLRPHIRRFLTVFAVFTVLTPAIAQFPEPIRAKIYVPPVQGILTENSEWAQIPSTVQIVTAEGQKPFRLSRNGYSKDFVVPPDGNLMIYRLEEGSSRRAALWIQLKLTPGIQEALILVRPGTEDENGQVQAQVLDVTSTLFESGNVAFHNFLKNPVRLTLGELEVTLAPNQPHMLKIEEGRVRIFLEEVDGTRGRRYTGAVHVRRDDPTIVTIEPNPSSSRRLAVNTFTGMTEEQE